MAKKIIRPKNAGPSAFTVYIVIGITILTIIGVILNLPPLPSPDPVRPPVVQAPPDGPISASGTILCLPHKNTKGPQTLECAFGLKDDQGIFYSLNDTDPEYKNVSAAPMNTRVKVMGTFTEKNDDIYPTSGVIYVTKIETFENNP